MLVRWKGINFDRNKITSLMRSNRRNELKHIQLAFEHRKGMLFIIPLENYLLENTFYRLVCLVWQANLFNRV